MIFRHSIKNLFRSGMKSILFFLLLLLLVIMLSTGTSLTSAIYSFLAECNKDYTTIGVLEYRGVDYPDETDYDNGIAEAAKAFDFSLLEDNKNVKLWDSTEKALGYVPGITRRDSQIPYRENGVYVIYITNCENPEYNSYTGLISKTLYSFRDIEGNRVSLYAYNKKLEVGHFYVIHGELYSGSTSLLYMNLAPYFNMRAMQEGFSGDYDRMVEDVTTKDGKYEVSKDSYFNEIANSYQVLNNGVTVYATSDVSALLPFQQNSLYLVKGRSFSEQEYKAGEKVCIISGQMAKLLNITIGDTIPLSIATAEECPMNQSYWAGSGFTYQGDYTVVGLFNDQKDMLYDVFIPKSKDTDLSANHFTYTLGQAVIKNGKTDDVVKKISPLLPERVFLTIYDQGYSSMEEPLKNILHTAVIITCISMIAGLVLISLFGFLFVYRQRDVIRTMLRLGTGKKNVFSYFLFEGGLISLAAAMLGVVISFLLSGYVVKVVNLITSKYSNNDLLFSKGNLSIKKAIGLFPDLSISAFILVGIAVFVMTLLSCFIFTNLSIVPHTKKKRRERVTGSVKSQSLKGGFLKYAVISIVRGKLRSIIPFLVSLSAVILICQLTGTREIYQGKQEQIHNNSEITGYFTDISGKQTSGLAVEGYLVNDLNRSGYLSKISVSKAFNYFYQGHKSADGKMDDMATPIKSQSSFSAETFIGKISKGPQIAFTNDLKKVPEFMYSSSIVTEFMPGYDEMVLSDNMDETVKGLVSTNFMETTGVKFGDTVQLALAAGNNIYYMKMLVIGSYVKQGMYDNIYCQLDGIFPNSILFSKDPEVKEKIFGYTLSSAFFELKSSSELSEFKQYLMKQGFSEVNNIRAIRNFISLDDSQFLSTENALSQKLWYMDRIFPALYCLIELLAVLISFLLIHMRKKEIAIMRGMGAPKHISFLSLYAEQILLCLIGSSIGLGLSMLIFGIKSSLGYNLSAVFIVCWLTGAALSTMRTNQETAITLLHEKE